MVNFLKKLILFAGLCSCISLLSVDFASAQQLKIEHRKEQGLSEFAEKYGADATIMSLLKDESDGDNEKILCGSQTQVCDKKTQVCLKCEYNGSFTRHSHGLCVSKSEVNEENL